MNRCVSNHVSSAQFILQTIMNGYDVYGQVLNLCLTMIEYDTTW